ncbi:MAG TPA: chemotaxis protein CheD [bacterium]|nr:chemotaxis protein CheD [bacterium]
MESTTATGKTTFVVGVADMKTGTAGQVLVTHALGSCLGLMIYDPVLRVGGLLHAMLPLSQINPEKAVSNPFMFVDTGVPELFRAVYALGGEKGRIVVKVAGCARPLNAGEMFRIGERNHVMLKKLLWKNSILISAEDVGGTAGRTVHFDLDTGRVVIKSGAEEHEL